MCSLISVYFEVWFASSPCIVCKAWSIPRNSRISRSVFCNASRVLAWISLTKDESSISGMLSFSISFGNSCLSLVAALKDFSNAGGVLLKFKTIFITFNPANLSLYVFRAKNSPVHLFVSDCQCLPSKKSKFVLPGLEIVLSINQSTSARPEFPITIKCLYNT